MEEVINTENSLNEILIMDLSSSTKSFMKKRGKGHKNTVSVLKTKE